jgi:Flp pilus assembly pilin Flp
MNLKRDDGQATVEHLGLVAIIALVLVSATAVVATASPSIRNRVTTQFMHALCVVTGDQCQTLAQAPCPLLRTVKTTGQSVAIGVIRLGHDQVLSIERRSDGTYVMSLLEGAQAGAGIASGLTHGAGALGAEATALLGGRAGRTFTAATPEEARALVHRLRHDYFPAAHSVIDGVADLAGLAETDPSVESYVLAGDGAIDAVGKFGLGNLVEGGVKGSLKGQVGVRIAAHEQAITVYQQLDAAAGVFFGAFTDLSVPLGGLGKTASSGKTGSVKAGAEASVGASLSVTNPLAQELEGGAVAGGSLALKFGPGPSLQSIEMTGYAGTGSRRKEVHVQLDPSDPRVQEALRAWRAAPTSPASFAGLGAAAVESSAVDIRAFKTSGSDHQQGVEAALGGLALGATFGSESGVSELIEQDSKPIGGVWERRLDCVTTTASVRSGEASASPVALADRRGARRYVSGPSTSGVPAYARSSALKASRPTAFARSTHVAVGSPASRRVVSSLPTASYAALSSAATAVASGASA